MKNVRKEVLEAIKPSKKEKGQLQKSITATLKKLNGSLKRAKAIIGGSGAKGTFLKNQKDADIFVLYEKEFSHNHNISDELEKTIKSLFPIYQRIHGSRDYFQVKNDVLFEFVPIIKIRRPSEAENITDISPLHSAWVLKHASEKQKDDIRLLKAFCKANHIYGAESHIKGFSGYVCEILIIHYGSFEKTLRSASAWKEKTVIDPAKYYKRKNVFMAMNASKIQAPLIIVDPVQESRNAAAALSADCFHAFKDQAKKLQKKPSASFFRQKDMTKESIIRIAKNKPVFIVKANLLDGKDDIVGSKALKVFTFLKAELERGGFVLLESQHQFQGSAFMMWFILEADPIPASFIHKGPPLSLPKHVAVFKKRYPSAKPVNGILQVAVKRKFPRAGDLFKKSISSPYNKDKVKQIQQIHIA
ncbi:CCA tRNA nucleotidyltransferase [Candidatus Woesearchaeota archaeon]|nr:CCA tRNA nucleotidyltransferase [Candidatus Woesearchaeota archaeon]HIH38254.1 CCA tRNA nucleotidyltransferase [Candidatus Woesearchaeota archaeon]HIH49172.1 CCA tRNA nucleotidyltransferase [Candidatus Woesearchaeota archaeon]HIJ04410.1 CCA tRNA nucleotidyltransferase [Candidatus Woesearchaeota archaeon]